jgi:cytochrome b561
MLFRVGWRLLHSPPSLRCLLPFHRYAARTVHGLLYASLLVQPLTGYLSSAFGRYGVSLFGLPVAPFAHPEPQARQVLIATHHLGAWLLSGLLLLHIGAATWHRFWGERTIAARMWFRGSVHGADN